ncbi:hypothetical protein ABID08_005081 [Rhizobium binae]|uniref:DUF4158 domain-containing protein n=1 Tax=Rhizobium binae TaxID=1138190 RepID=A0ABV2MMM0_9HYPH|nr:DUF4158 domain-containing protein [Rhizobium binae]
MGAEETEHEQCRSSDVQHPNSVDCYRHAPILISLSGPTRQRFTQIGHEWSPAMAKRKLLKDQDRRKLVDIPVDENSLIRHYSLSLADRLEIELRRRNHNRLGFAIQL